MAISRRYTFGAQSAWNAVFHPNVTRQENRKGKNRAKSATQSTRIGHKGAGIALSQIVLGLICPGRPSRGGKSQNGAKSRRFGMDTSSRAFYEGVNPKTILNNCHRLGFNRHRRCRWGVRQLKSAVCHCRLGKPLCGLKITLKPGD